MEQNSNNIPELQSPFGQLREVDADGKEWWNSRKLARVMGYGKYWNFERVIAKAQAWTSQKGYHLGEHFVEITEMAELGSGAVREVTSIRLSRAACMAVAMNADQKKEMVKAAQQYFSATMTPDVAVRSMESSILMYKGGRGKVQVQVVFDTKTFWLSQQRMAELFGVTVPTINYHLDQIEQSGEIHLSDAIRKIRIPSDKWSGEVMMYNLDTVIAVGYRVNSYGATQFRIWATQVLKEYLTKGFVLDDERLKGKNVFGADYFDDLLDRIREIRISERRYYQKITDIYSECSSDYDKDSEETQFFFKTVQNMMHYALSQLESVPDLTLHGPQNRLGVIAFNLGKHHAYDVGSFLDNYGIAVRTGHHCAMPLMAYYNVPAMCRASLAMYNTHEEVDRLVTGLQRIHRLLG